LEAKEMVNELTVLAQTEETHRLLSRAYDVLDLILSPPCLKCKVKAKRLITSLARLYYPEIAELPGGTRTFWTGEWFCPECGSVVATGKRWWVGES